MSEEHAVGEIVCDLGLTRSLFATTDPQDWRNAAGIIRAFLNRSPVRDSVRYNGVRVMLGAFALELEAYARQAGEPEPPEIDLRAPEVKEGERHARDRAAMTHAS